MCARAFLYIRKAALERPTRSTVPVDQVDKRTGKRIGYKNPPNIEAGAGSSDAFSELNPFGEIRFAA